MGKRLTTEEFIEKARQVHGDKYDYSKVEYVSNSTKVCIICKEHGEFWQVPNSHLNGNGCPSCGGVRRLTEKDFIERANSVHSGKYTYNHDFVSTHKKVTITCPIHGNFTQLAKNHLKGQGCPLCGQEIAKNRLSVDIVNHRKTTEEFKQDVKLMYGDKFEVLGEYVNNKTLVKLYCHEKNCSGVEHGEFTVRPNDLLNGTTQCHKCSRSVGKMEEEFFNFVKEIYHGEVIFRDRRTLEGKEIDIFLPNKKIGFEIDGLYWHSEVYHPCGDMCKKSELAEKKGVKIYNIFEDEWDKKKNIVKERVKSILGIYETVVYARKCTILPISSKDAQNFEESNHLQGKCSSSFNYGLFYNGELVSLMTFGNLRKNLGSKKENGVYELLRYCSLGGYKIIGGASKLLKKFINDVKPSEIISYCDRRWSSGELYEKMGFNLVSVTKPNYYYLFNRARVNRFSLRKDVLVRSYGCPIDKTEHEFCLENKWFRVYDRGNFKFKLELCK